LLGQQTSLFHIVTVSHFLDEGSQSMLLTRLGKVQINMCENKRSTTISGEKSAATVLSFSLASQLLALIHTI